MKALCDNRADKHTSKCSVYILIIFHLRPGEIYYICDGGHIVSSFSSFQLQQKIHLSIATSSVFVIDIKWTSTKYSVPFRMNWGREGVAGVDVK